MATSEIIGIDSIFSYWILLWVLIYILVENGWFGGSSRRYFPSPILALWIGLVFGFYLLLHILSKAKFVTSIIYIIVVFILKIIPLYLLRNYPVDILRDSLALVILFFIYNAYLSLVHHTNVVNVYKVIEKSIIDGENKTPFFRFAYGVLYQ